MCYSISVYLGITYYINSLNISVSSCNRCFGQGIHELTEIVREFRKLLK